MMQEQAGKSLDGTGLVAKDGLQFDMRRADLPITHRMKTVGTDLSGTGLERFGALSGSRTRVMYHRSETESRTNSIRLVMVFRTVRLL